jgi:hypothetical protein
MEVSGQCFGTPAALPLGKQYTVQIRQEVGLNSSAEKSLVSARIWPPARRYTDWAIPAPDKQQVISYPMYHTNEIKEKLSCEYTGEENGTLRSCYICN